VRRSNALPPRPDLGGRARPAPARRDPVLLTVVAIGLLAVVTAAALVIAPPDARVTRAHPSPAVSHMPSPTPTRSASHQAVPLGPGGAYAFLDATRLNGQRSPVRWNPCQPIEYQLQFEVRPPGARSSIAAAIEEASRATGIPFRYDGPATVGAHALFTRSFIADPVGAVYLPVLIAVVSRATFHTFETSKRAIAFSHPEEGKGALRHQYVAGVVVVDGSARYAQAGRWSLRLVVQHELGHLIGLGHVRAPDELMFSFEVAHHTIPDPISGWGPGDLRGLRRLGADQGCLETVRVRG